MSGKRASVVPTAARPTMPTPPKEIQSRSRVSVRGANTHNLRSVDLDVPYYRLTALCGVSGSGKSSLAFDVLYAEGRRRYVESLSPFARQKLEMMEVPDVESIDGIPAAIAVSAETLGASSKATVGTVAETEEYLRYLFARVGRPYCQSCGKRLRNHTAETTVKAIQKLPSGTKIAVAFAPSLQSVNAGLENFKAEWLEKGFYRGISQNSTFDLRDNTLSPMDFGLVSLMYNTLENEEDVVFDDWGLKGVGNAKEKTDERRAAEEKQEDDEEEVAKMKTNSRALMLNVDGDESALMRYLSRYDAVKRNPGVPPIFFIVDRVVVGKTEETRLIDSVETAFEYGDSRCWIVAQGSCSYRDWDEENEEASVDRVVQGRPKMIDGKEWSVFGFSKKMRCDECGVDFPDLEPNLFNFNSPKGACPICSGLGWWSAFDMGKVFPNHNLSIREGAIAPWTQAAYRPKISEFLSYAEQLDVRVDVPFYQLSREEINAILNGSSKLNYKGLNGFFWNLWDQKYKMHIRSFLKRWLVQCECPVCKGARLRKEALAVKICDKNLGDLGSATIDDALAMINAWTLNERERKIAAVPLQQIKLRLERLQKVGLGYLSLTRELKTLSEGERRRVKLTSVLGSDLVNMLYVIDEPSVGLHPQDAENLCQSLYDLRDRGNTVLVVDHNETILNAADRIVELGPGAGHRGGRIVFEGSVEDIKANGDSLTGGYLSGRRGGGGVPKRKTPTGKISLLGAAGNNLKNINVDFPLGCLCNITGVSGAGKSSLALGTLAPALYARLGGDKSVVEQGLPYKRLLGADQLNEALFVDQSPIGRSPRSNPVTYLKIFDDIRALFASSQDAKTRNFNAGHFSFNVDGGRCDMCKGEGYLKTEMQFVADVFTRCPICNGKRYQQPILDVMYRARNIYDTLEMTAREAFEHFRGQTKIQQKLKRLIDVGLDYIKLGQPANTLSGGEAQRLKLCSFLSTQRKGPCLFIFDEPTTGLHFADVVKLLDVFNSLIDAGHSIVVVDHNPLVMRAADYVIDMGPGAADEGGRVVAQGTPEEIAADPNSITGKYIAKALNLKK